MKPIAFLTIPLLLANHAAFAGSADGNGALALAALVAEHSPGVNAIDKNVLAKFLNGYANVRYAPNKKSRLRPARSPAGRAMSTSPSIAAI
jgi:hypothetical protein